jgi:hypothetical protein
VADIIASIGTFLEQLSNYVLPHAPFIGVMFILLIVGTVTSRRVFTKPRAYRYYGTTAAGKWKWRFFYWGRETLAMQPILAGVAIGLFWKDPELQGWSRRASVAYFASAGAISMMLWIVIKAWTKKKGIVITLPGESDPPPDGTYPVSVRPLPYDSVPPILDEASQESSSEELAFEESDTIPPKPAFKAGLPPPNPATLLNPPPKLTLHGEEHDTRRMRKGPPK